MEPALSDAVEILQAYDLGHARSLTRLHSGFANLNYQLTTDRQNILLRVCNEQSDDRIRYEMSLLEHLRTKDFPAAYPIPRTDGGFTTGHPLGTIVLYQFIPGQEPESNPMTVAEAGQAVARLNSVKDWSGLERRNGLDLDLCHRVIEDYDEAPHKYPVLFEFFRKETSFLEDALRENLPVGLIHGDVFPDNTIFQGNQLLAIIDWEEACTDRLLIDVAVTINGFCFIDNRFDESLMQSFLKGYESIRRLTDQEKELLRYYIRWGAHCMIAWHLDHIIHEPDQRKLDRALMFQDRLANLDLS